MSENVTNVTEVIINIGQHRIPADDFSCSTSRNTELVHGAGNKQPRGKTHGTHEHEWEFTVQGEDAELLDELFTDENGETEEFDIKFAIEEDTGETGVYTLSSCSVTDDEFSGSDGEAVEYSASGIAHRRKQELLR